MWHGLRLTDLHSGAEQGAEGVQIDSVERSASTRLYRVEFSLRQRDHAGHLLEWRDAVQTTGVLLPGDPVGRGIERQGSRGYVVEFGFAFRSPDGTERHVTHLQARLAKGPLAQRSFPAALWAAYQHSDARSAMQLLEEAGRPWAARQHGRALARRSLLAPVLALVALRGGRWREVAALLQRAARRYGDVAVMAAVQALRDDGDPTDAVHRMLDALNTTPPRLSETFGLIALHAPDWEAAAPDMALQLHGLRQRVAVVQPFLRPGGLFPVFRGYTHADEVLAWYRRTESLVAGAWG